MEIGREEECGPERKGYELLQVPGSNSVRNLIRERQRPQVLGNRKARDIQVPLALQTVRT